tara:strand:+ start:364 stop:795 length:432 start_codon:yes stop_codon:yes gene_type:complete
MFLLNGNPLPIDTPFEIDGTQYPSNWLRLTSIEEKNAVGITEVADPEHYDDRFYWGVDNPKDLADLKTNWTAQVKDTTNKLLLQTDWMYIRKLDRNVDVPAATVTYRAAVITECTRLIASIDAATDVPGLITAITTQTWPTQE